MASRGRNICQKLYPFVSSSNSYCPCSFTMLSSIPNKEHTSPTLLPCLPNSPVTWFYPHSTEVCQGTAPASCHCSYRRLLHLGSYRSCCSAQSQVTTTAHLHISFLNLHLKFLHYLPPGLSNVPPYMEKCFHLTYSCLHLYFLYSVQVSTAGRNLCQNLHVFYTVKHRGWHNHSSHQWEAEDQTPGLQIPRAKGLIHLCSDDNGEEEKNFSFSVRLSWKYHSSWTNIWWNEPTI